MTATMNSVPTGWTTATVRDLVDLINGYAFKPSDWEDDGLPIIKIQNLNRPDAPFNRFGGSLPTKFLVKDGALLFAWSGTPGTSFGAHVWRRGDAWLNQHIYKVVFPEDLLNKGYLRYAINNNLGSYIRQAHGGAGLAHITKGRFEASELLVPPLLEQHRLVAKIEELFSDLDKGVEALETVQKLLKRYRQSVLKAAFDGKLTAGWREEQKAKKRRVQRLSTGNRELLMAAETRATYGEPETAAELLERIRDERKQALGKKYKQPPPLDATDLPELPGSWQWASMADLGIVSGGLTKNAKRKAYPMRLPYLRVANVYADRLELGEVKEIGVKDSELDRVLLAAGDLLVVEGNGSIDQIGRVALWDGSISPCVHQNHLIKVRFEVSELGRLILCWLLSPDGRACIKRVTSSTSGLHTLSISKVAKLPVPVLPLAEQRVLVDEVERRLSLADGIESAVSQDVKRSGRLRQSVLKRAFEGKLVPQDPNDEPAEELLERIRAEREKNADAKPKRRTARKRKS